MSPLMVLVLPILAAMASTVVDSMSVMPGCQSSCGGPDIPYPFGIGTGCFRKGFEVACVKNSSSAGESLVLASTDQTIQVLELAVFPSPFARVLLPVAWQCFNSTGDVTGNYTGDVNFNPEGVYRISDTENELFVLGCNTFIYAKGVRWHDGRFSYKYYAGCVAVTNNMSDPKDGACAGLGCCHVDIPPDFTDTTMSMSTGGGWGHADQEFCPCDFAFIVEKGKYTFKASDLLSTHIPNNQTTPLSVDWTMPLRLDWAIRDNGSTTSISCDQAPIMPDHEYACRSNHSKCIDSTNSPGYICNCTQGYQGNPYLVGGCTNIDECQFKELHYCPNGSKCVDMDGTYRCECKLFRRGKDCRPMIAATGVALIAIFVAVIFGCVAIALLQKLNNKKRSIKNGGKILETKKIKIYTNRELNKITKGYSKRLGGGYFGNVYEGCMTDGKKVAVKRSKLTSVGHRWMKLIRPQVPQGPEEDGSFINEIEFQFDARHKNMVQLLGCCLETDIPMLVFEFISNGSLDDALHSTRRPCTLTLMQRLDIAIGSAEAVAYMHSLGNQKHVHGDIKPSNILLENDLSPKVSDFGSSKLLAVDSYYVRAVAGDTGYMDPLYFQTNHYTMECDVYSFGVVLLELITRKKAKYQDKGDKVLSLEFLRCMKDEGSGRTMYDEKIYSSGEDAQSQRNAQCLDKIGMLAVQCLKEDKRERPNMEKVVKELKQAKAIAFPNQSTQINEANNEMVST